ncbi:hypothetical protein BOKEGFJH_00469 [Chlamydia avium]|uniref:Uncharacterized protein n=1 Tax=Chlamydia avium 10DC88 TaxID=1229831 RepID=W8JFK3_9CHLA|nr:Uncharacterized protein M832_04780 [Chlamydia avium 10DC88]VVT42943.1 hypothetical protein BOKEGFJH_00469 [Chlamydia avium]
MYRSHQITFSLPSQSLFKFPLIKEPPHLICKKDFLYFLLGAFLFNRMYKFLSKIGITRLTMFVLYAFMWVSMIYLSAFCVLHLLCCCTTHSTSKSKRSVFMK